MEVDDGWSIFRLELLEARSSIEIKLLAAKKLKEIVSMEIATEMFMVE
ncbi:hypothetical protein WN944_010208 [Citrus x changshan-huyou]|uniref:Uncharacterized protein n=1 Tax=Citrus x changshan-huyou TaxID=2935761 RepID=A0AAP0MUH1_9ROSI